MDDDTTAFPAGLPALRHGGWSRDMFAQSGVIGTPDRFIFLAGIGAEVDGDKVEIAHPGDFAAQCRLAYETAERRLRREGASFRNVVRIVAYVTDMSNRQTYFEVQGLALKGAPRPPHTLVAVHALADSRMMVEIEVTAAFTGSTGPQRAIS